MTRLVDIDIVGTAINFEEGEYLMTLNNKENGLGYTIGKTNWYMKTLLNNLLKDGFNITNEQWIVLKVISSNPAASQTEIAEISLKDKTNITRILDLLEKSSLIVRRRDENDRRMNRIHITEKGTNKLEEVYPVTQKTEKICTSSLNKKQVKELVKTLDAICIEIKKEL